MKENVNTYLQTMNAIDLLKKIVGKGGVIGACGKFYLSDECLAAQYVMECSKQLHSSSIRLLWGEKLVKELNYYRLVNGC